MGYNKIIIPGKQFVDYLYVQDNPVDKESFKSIESEPKQWTKDTKLLARFDENLYAGNSSLAQSITGYEIRRRKGSDPYTEYIGKVPEKKDGSSELSQKYIIDYLASNRADYIYYLYPAAEDINTGEGVLMSPSQTHSVKPDWRYWSLMVVDETEEDNVFYLDKLFKFELNVTVDDFSNNAVVSVNQNFTKYPTVQYGTANYWSGGLTSLCGMIASNDMDVIQTPNMIEELKALTSDTRRMFLKDIHGNVWEIKITSPIIISTEQETIKKLKSVKIGWTEVGKVSNISVINNPDKPTVDWVLTETGIPVPYINYIWDEQYLWNNEFRWTSNDSHLSNQNMNSGREVKGGDIE